MAVQLPKNIDPNTVREMIADFHANHHAIVKQWGELVEVHEGEWVASYNGEFVFGATIEQVVEKAKARGWLLGVIAIDQLLRERANILL